VAQRAASLEHPCTAATIPLSSEVTIKRGRTARLVPLTSLRFFAALLVIAHHFAPYPLQWSSLSAEPTLVGRLCALALNGFVGVDLFFVLSGFILAYSYLAPGGRLRGTPHAFWRARVARIYPLYLLAYIAAALPFAWSHDPRAPLLPTALAALTLTQAWIPWAASTWNPPGWSLSVEVLFYALFPLLLPALARLPRRRYPLAFAVLWAACCAVPLAYITKPNASLVWLWTIVYNPVLRLPEFLIGVMAGLIFIGRSQESKKAGRAQRALPYVGLGALTIAIAVLATAPAWLRPFLRAGALDPLFALLIFALAVGGGPLAGLLARPLPQLLGEASYAMYILHWPLWDWLTRLTGISTATGRASWAFCLDYLGIVVGVSVLALWTIEQPARAALRGRLKRSRPREQGVRGALYTSYARIRFRDTM